MPRNNRFLRWLPFLLGAVVVAATLILWNALKAREETHIARMVQMKTLAVSDGIRHAIESRIQALDRMAKRWEARGMPSRAEWEGDAALYIEHYAGYQAIGWVDPSFRARWVVPQKENGTAAGSDFASGEHQKEALLAARERRQVVFTRAVDLARDDMGFLACLPIFPEKGFGGFIVGAFRSRDLLGAILRDDVEMTGYAIAILEGEVVQYASGNATDRSEPRWMKEAELPLYGVSWRVRVWPKTDYLAEIHSPLPEVTLVLGIVLALMLALAAYFARTAWLKEQEVEAVNRDLQRENLERRRAEETVARHAAEVERSNAELQQFAYVASHDLQEPLRIVSGYVQLLARRYQGKLDAEADEFIAFAVDGAARMQALISDLLTYSRVGSRREDFQPVNSGEVLDHALKSLRLAIEENKAVVTHDPLPTVTANARQLDQLFMNLIGNAIKYRSEAPPMIHVSAVEKAEEWRFSVRDNGIGIDPKYFERIFVIFQRLHARGEYPGTGIGLAICKKVVENHGGRIWVESQPGQGATFYFTIHKNRG